MTLSRRYSFYLESMWFFDCSSSLWLLHIYFNILIPQIPSILLKPLCWFFPILHIHLFPHVSYTSHLFNAHNFFHDSFLFYFIKILHIKYQDHCCPTQVVLSVFFNLAIYIIDVDFKLYALVGYLPNNINLKSYINPNLDSYTTKKNDLYNQFRRQK